MNRIESTDAKMLSSVEPTPLVIIDCITLNITTLLSPKLVPKKLREVSWNKKAEITRIKLAKSAVGFLCNFFLPKQFTSFCYISEVLLVFMLF
jgi:hypothetical protein